LGRHRAVHVCAVGCAGVCVMAKNEKKEHSTTTTTHVPPSWARFNSAGRCRPAHRP
jgi:hypothetical protein